MILRLFTIQIGNKNDLKIEEYVVTIYMKYIENLILKIKSSVVMNSAEKNVSKNREERDKRQRKSCNKRGLLSEPQRREEASKE